MKIYKFFILFIIFILLLSCTGFENVKDDPKKIVSEKMVWSSSDKRPGWLYKEPDTEGEHYYFVGRSDKTVSEKESVNSAERDAVTKVSKYISTDIVDKWQSMLTGMNIASDIIDPTIAQKNITEQTSNNITRRVKTKEVYVEKYQVNYDKGSSAVYYLTSVLRYVPTSTLDKIITSQEKYQQEVRQLVQDINSNIETVDKFINVEKLRKSNQPVKSYNNLLMLKNKLESFKSKIKMYPEIKKFSSILYDKTKAIDRLLSDILTNPAARFNAGVVSLLSNSETLPVTLTVGKIVFENSEMGSSFSRYIISEIERVLTSAPELCKVISQDLFQKQLEIQKVSVDDILLAGKELTGILNKIECIITGNYFVKDDNILINLSLFEKGSGVLKKSVELEYQKSDIPDKISINPNNMDVFNAGYSLLKDKDDKDKDFKIKIWPGKGEGMLYYKNELLNIFFKSNRDAYVYLFHMDSAGDVKMLFPNSYSKDNYVKGGQVYSIPDDKMNFTFQVGEPYGSEIIKSIASLQKIDSFELYKMKQSVFKDMGKVSDKDIGVRFRGIDVIPADAKAEDVCFFTTLLE